MRWSHSGKYGDLIWSLPAMMGIAERYKQAKTPINLSGSLREWFQWAVPNIAPLLQAQSYIESVSTTPRQWQDVCGDVYWQIPFKSGVLERDWNIPRLYLWHFGLPYSRMEKPWLTVAPKPVAKCVVNRTMAHEYHNPKMQWGFIKNRPDTVFVGTKQEHDAFCRDIWKLPHYPTANLLEVAEVIAGAEFFVGNQGCNHTIAEALKKKIWLEVSPYYPSVIVQREGVTNIQ